MTGIAVFAGVVIAIAAAGYGLAVLVSRGEPLDVEGRLQ